jgi:RecG-like helicase
MRQTRFGLTFGLPALLFAVIGLHAQDAGPKKVAADDLITQFKKSAAKANKENDGVTFELTDTIFQVGKHYAGNKPCITLQGTGKNKNSSLLCFTTDPEPWAKFANGQKVKIVGKWKESTAIAELADCEPTAVTKDGPIAMTAEQLAKESAKGFKAMDAKFGKKAIVVTGKYVDAKVEKSDYTFVKLQGAGKAVITCEVPPAEKEAMSKLKAGETVRFAGTYSSTESNGTGVRISSCWPVSMKK